MPALIAVNLQGVNESGSTPESAQLLAQAWADPALFPEEVRNYVRRMRKIFVDLEIPVDLINKPGRGYSLIFRNE